MCVCVRLYRECEKERKREISLREEDRDRQRGGFLWSLCAVVVVLFERGDGEE